MITDCADLIQVELVYSPSAGEVHRLPLTLPAGATVAAALRLARVQWRDLPPNPLTCGVYGQPVGDLTVLAEGDRLECYRPLSADPKDARRERVERARRQR